MAQATKLEGYEELVTQVLASVPRSKLPGVLARFPAKVVAAGLTAEQLAALPAEKLAALPAEKRLAGLSVRELVAGLGPEELEALRAELLGPQGAKAKPKRRQPKAPR